MTSNGPVSGQTSNDFCFSKYKIFPFCCFFGTANYFMGSGKRNRVPRALVCAIQLTSGVFVFINADIYFSLYQSQRECD